MARSGRASALHGDASWACRTCGVCAKPPPSMGTVSSDDNGGMQLFHSSWFGIEDVSEDLLDVVLKQLLCSMKIRLQNEPLTCCPNARQNMGMLENDLYKAR